MVSRDEAIAAGMDALTQGTKDAIGGAYDAGVASQPVAVPAPGTVSQADYDAAVAKISDESATIDTLTASLKLDDDQVAKLKGALGGLAAEINALLVPAS